MVFLHIGVSFEFNNNNNIIIKIYNYYDVVQDVCIAINFSTISLWVLFLDSYLDFISGLTSFQTSVKKTMAPEQVKFNISIFSENWQLCLYTYVFSFHRQEILYQYYAYAFHGSAVSWRARFYYIYSIPSKCRSWIIYHTCSLQQFGITFS